MASVLLACGVCAATFVGAAMAAQPPGALSAAVLPSLGDPADLSLADERRLGDRIVRELYRDPDYLDDPVIADYVQSIWKPLLAAARARGELSDELHERFAWEILLGRDRSVNAFALPGGFLGLHLGLVGAVSTRDELASVLAHELSHVTQRHIARLITQQNRQTPLLLGAMVLGALAASKNPGATQALIVGGQALAIQNQLNFSRDMEREADRIGYTLMEPAGFSPIGFVSMFDKLQQANRLNDNGSWPYLRSHPLTTQRMADMQARLPADARPASPVQPQPEAAIMAARAKVLAQGGVDQWRQWAAEPSTPGFAQQPPVRQLGAWYAAVLSRVQLRDAAGARQGLGPLRALAGMDLAAQRQVRLLAAEVELAAGQPEAALALLSAGGARPETLLRTQALLNAGRAVEAADALQLWVSQHPRDASAWQRLAAARQALGQTLRAVRAEAEAHAARYDYAAAIDRLKAGQELARSGADYVEASIIDTRLRAVESALREQAAER
ncbi:MAG: M48 family metalloprotease [Burkholderiaceae bacterium]